MIVLIKEYFDCFAWSYTEMLGLSRELAKHRLLINIVLGHLNKKRLFHLDLLLRIKDKINWLLKANFIRPCKYVEWVSNIMQWKRKTPVRSGYVLIFVI